MLSAIKAEIERERLTKCLTQRRKGAKIFLFFVTENQLIMYYMKPESTFNQVYLVSFLNLVVNYKISE